MPQFRTGLVTLPQLIDQPGDDGSAWKRHLQAGTIRKELLFMRLISAFLSYVRYDKSAKSKAPFLETDPSTPTDYQMIKQGNI